MLYYLDEADKQALDRVESTSFDSIGWSEKDLENLIARNIDKIISEEELFVINQERRGVEEPDILALDQDGRLFIFELKRWNSSPKNLLQVLRYGQIFGRYQYKDLKARFQNYQKRVGGNYRSELREAHGNYFELESLLPPKQFNREQKFVIITDGLDRGTRQAIEYWSQQDLPVSAIPYRVHLTEDARPVLDIRQFSVGGELFDPLREGLRVVNTNSSYMPDAWQDMLDEEKASAYYGRKSAVEDIPVNSPVALYHTDVGIVAVGTTTGPVCKAAVGDDADAEYFVPCNFKYKVNPKLEAEKAVKAREINDFLDESHRFRSTVYTLPPRAIGFIDEKLEERQ